jgi:hypothetical protein
MWVQPERCGYDDVTTQPGRTASEGSACLIASITESRLSSSVERQPSLAGYVGDE